MLVEHAARARQRLTRARIEIIVRLGPRGHVVIDQEAAEVGCERRLQLALDLRRARLERSSGRISELDSGCARVDGFANGVRNGLTARELSRERIATLTNVLDLQQMQENLDDLNAALAHNNNRASEAEPMVPYVFAGAYTNRTTKFDYTCTLQPRTGKTNNYSYNLRNPFLNVAVDEHIIKNHNDIENPVVLNFLREFILFATQTNYVVGVTNDSSRVEHPRQH